MNIATHTKREKIYLLLVLICLLGMLLAVWEGEKAVGEIINHYETTYSREILNERHGWALDNITYLNITVLANRSK